MSLISIRPVRRSLSAGYAMSCSRNKSITSNGVVTGTD